MEFYTEFNPTLTLPSVQTGSGRANPKGIGKVLLPLPNTKIVLENVLYIPEFPLSIISGQLHYKTGSKISGNKLLDSKGNTFTILNYKEGGFIVSLATRKSTNYRITMETEGSEPRVTLDPNPNPNPGTATATATDPVPALVPDPTATTVTTETSHYITQL
jgi:hypothetical protein